MRHCTRDVINQGCLIDIFKASPHLYDIYSSVMYFKTKCYLRLNIKDFKSLKTLDTFMFGEEDLVFLKLNFVNSDL